VLVSEGAHDSTAALVTAGATSLAALAAVFAFVVAWLTVHDNRRTERKRREDDSLTAQERLTYEYVGRLEDLALTDHKAVMASFLRGGFRPPGMRDADWQAAKGSRLDICRVDCVVPFAVEWVARDVHVREFLV
jgi:hypothetical protein